MSGKYLGDAFDIHGGGMDLKFPHHENEKAQSQAGGRAFAKYWMHNGWLTMAGEKMSKSLGNTATVTEVVKRFPARAVRLYLLAPHYRSAVELSDDALTEATAQLARLDSFLARAGEVLGEVAPGEVPAEFAAAMDDDLGTPAAVAVLFQLVRAGNQALDGPDLAQAEAALAGVRAILSIFGLDPEDEAWRTAGEQDRQLKPVLDGLVAALLAQRQQARARKDFNAADAIRDELARLGLKIEDTPTGARWSLG
jgi:cysteinyl-tRNA synthetase